MWNVPHGQKPSRPEAEILGAMRTSHAGRVSSCTEREVQRKSPPKRAEVLMEDTPAARDIRQPSHTIRAAEGTVRLILKVIDFGIGRLCTIGRASARMEPAGKGAG